MLILIPGGCAWTSGQQALTVDEYRTLEERWSEERERRLEAMLDERFDQLREREERLQTLERRTEGILAGLRELEAAQREAISDQEADSGDRDDSGGDANGNGSPAADASGSGGNDDGDDIDGGASDDEGNLDLERDPGSLKANEPLVFGSKECIRLPEQGLVLRARVDSGANTASLNAVDIREFERDGDPWVRFRIPDKGLGEAGISGTEESDDDDEDVFDEVLDAVDSASESENEEAVGVRAEAEIHRRVTIIQASGEEERVVVRLPTRIGPFDRRVEYTLADRTAMDFPVLLGRRMLRDLAVIDVAREYLQPCPPA